MTITSIRLKMIHHKPQETPLETQTGTNLSRTTDIPNTDTPNTNINTPHASDNITPSTIADASHTETNVVSAEHQLQDGHTEESVLITKMTVAQLKSHWNQDWAEKISRKSKEELIKTYRDNGVHSVTIKRQDKVKKRTRHRQYQEIMAKRPKGPTQEEESRPESPSCFVWAKQFHNNGHRFTTHQYHGREPEVAGIHPIKAMLLILDQGLCPCCRRSKQMIGETTALPITDERHEVQPFRVPSSSNIPEESNGLAATNTSDPSNRHNTTMAPSLSIPSTSTGTAPSALTSPAQIMHAVMPNAMGTSMSGASADVSTLSSIEPVSVRWDYVKVCFVCFSFTFRFSICNSKF